MPILQDLIHKLEVGAGPRAIRWGAAGLALAMLMVGYNWRGFKNMTSQEAMDSAQLGRNLAQGKGYTTLFVRPFSTEGREMKLGDHSAAGVPLDSSPWRAMSMAMTA